MATLPDFFLELARGNVANAEIVTKFGLRTNINPSGCPADIWNGPRKDFPWPDNAVPLFISSDNNADDSSVEIHGLDDGLNAVSAGTNLMLKFDNR